MKAEFHGPCEIKVVCKCGAALEIEEIQDKGTYKTLYVAPCYTCADNNYWDGYHVNK